MLNSRLQSVRRILTAHAIVLTASSMLFSQPVLAQSTSSTESREVVSSSPSGQNAAKAKNYVETSVSVGSMAQLTATRIQDTTTSLTTESFAPSAGVFATFRQSFKPWLGFSVNLGYTHPTYRYTVSAPAASAGENIKCVSDGAYVRGQRFLHRAKSISLNNSPYLVKPAAGTIAFAAKNNGGYLPNRSNAFRPEGIAGFGVDYRLTHGLGLRAQYRGLFIRYPYPDDDLSPRLKTIISEPTLSLTYTFGQHGHR